MSIITKAQYLLSSTREERGIVGDIALYLEQAGIADALHKASLIVALNAEAAVNDYLPLLRHSECELILSRAYCSATIINCTANINTAVERVSKIVFALNSFSGGANRGELIPVKLADSIETVLTLYGNQIRQGAELIR